MDSASHLLIISNCPDAAVADSVSHALVEEQLAACVNVMPPMRSVYRWEGGTETADEVLLLIKARRVDYPAIQQRIVELHPYDVPEVIAVPVVDGLPAYLNWVDAPDA